MSEEDVELHPPTSGDPALHGKVAFQRQPEFKCLVKDWERDPDNTCLSTFRQRRSPVPALQLAPWWGYHVLHQEPVHGLVAPSGRWPSDRAVRVYLNDGLTG